MPKRLERMRNALIALIWGENSPKIDQIGRFWGMFFSPKAAWIGALTDDQVDSVLLGRS